MEVDYPATFVTTAEVFSLAAAKALLFCHLFLWSSFASLSVFISQTKSSGPFLNSRRDNSLPATQHLQAFFQ